MTDPRIARLTEVRRALPLAAAALVVAALFVPVWRITFEAPQYPTTDLVVELYAYPRLGGDFEEVQALNKYVGFYYPDPVWVEPNYEVHEGAIRTPEWLLGPVVFLGIAATGAFVALAPTERKLRLGLTAQFAGTVATLLGTGAVVQARLYQAGHSLDPDAPLRGVDGFTPPLLGAYEVANISGVAWFGPGGYAIVLAVVLLAVAYRLRGSTATVDELPELAASAVSVARRRLARAVRELRSEPQSPSEKESPSEEQTTTADPGSGEPAPDEQSALEAAPGAGAEPPGGGD